MPTAKPPLKQANKAPRPKANNGKVEAKLEAEIEAAEAALRAVEAELADPAAWSTPARSKESTARHESAQRLVEDLYEQYAG